MSAEPTRDGSGIYLLAGIGANLVWSTSFVATKLAYASFPPLTLGALRFVIAGIALSVALLIRREFVKPSAGDLAVLALSGFLGITLYFALENIGVQLTSASNAALIIAAYPAITMLMDRVVYGVKFHWLKGLGVAIAIFGVYLISYSGAGNGRLAGNIILFGAGFVWAFYSFATRKVVNKYPAVTVSFYQTLAGTILFIPLTLLERAEWRAPTAQSMFVAVYLGILCSVVAFMLYNYGLRKLPPTTAIMLANLTPVFGVLFSALVLQEELHARQLIGGAVVIFGVYLSVRQGWTKRVETPHP